MAAPRKSAVALAARERARAQAEEMTRRNEQLIELAAEFFVQDDKVAEIDADLERKIQQIRAQAEEKKSAARAEATAVVQRMIETGESKKSIADRLGLTSAELKKYLPVSALSPSSAGKTPAVEDAVEPASDASASDNN